MRRRDLLSGVVAGLSGVAAWAAAPGTYVFGSLPSRVQRVFAAGAPAAVLVYCVAPEKLMGWPWPLDEGARAFLARPFRALPMLGRLAGRGSTMPLEKLVALKPDVIVDAGTVDATYLSTAERVWRQTGIPYVLIDGRLTDSVRQLREAGRVLGEEGRAERLARYAQSALPGCDGVASGHMARVYLARGGDGLETALPGSVNAECIEAACGVNVAQGSGGSLARVSREQVLAWAPSVIVTQYPEFYTLALKDGFWSRLSAVREGRLLLAPAVPFGWLDGPPGVNRLIGVRWLARRLQRRPPEPDWIEEVREFYALFYGDAPAREVLERLPGLK